MRGVGVDAQGLEIDLQHGGDALALVQWQQVTSGRPREVREASGIS